MAITIVKTKLQPSVQRRKRITKEPARAGGNSQDLINKDYKEKIRHDYIVHMYRSKVMAVIFHKVVLHDYK